MLTRNGGNAPQLRTTRCSKQVPHKDINQTSTTLPLSTIPAAWARNGPLWVGHTHCSIFPHAPTMESSIIRHDDHVHLRDAMHNNLDWSTCTEHCRKLQYKDTKFVEHPSCISSLATALYFSECMISVPTASGQHQEISPLEISASLLERKGSRWLSASWCRTPKTYQRAPRRKCSWCMLHKVPQIGLAGSYQPSYKCTRILYIHPYFPVLGIDADQTVETTTPTECTRHRISFPQPTHHHPAPQVDPWRPTTTVIMHCHESTNTTTTPTQSPQNHRSPPPPTGNQHRTIPTPTSTQTHNHRNETVMSTPGR
jgi:hypothetical protein